MTINKCSILGLINNQLVNILYRYLRCVGLNTPNKNIIYKWLSQMNRMQFTILYSPKYIFWSQITFARLLSNNTHIPITLLIFMKVNLMINSVFSINIHIVLLLKKNLGRLQEYL